MKLDNGAHAFNPSSQEIEAGGSKLEASLGQLQLVPEQHGLQSKTFTQTQRPKRSSKSTISNSKSDFVFKLRV